MFAIFFMKRVCVVSSIKEMAATIRFAVETEEKVQEESLLKDKDFVVDLVRID